MMVPSGASGASSSEVSVNQAPLLPALQPQPPAAELDGGAANANNNIGVVPPAIPAESAASNNSNQPILDAPPLSSTVTILLPNLLDSIGDTDHSFFLSSYNNKAER